MPERDGYIPGVPCWIDTGHPDPEAVLRFYEGLFGWQFEDAMPGDAEGRYFIGRIRGGDVAAVGSIPEGAPPVAVWNTYVWVDSADAAVSKCRDAGGGVVMEPFDVMDAGRMAVLGDPEGAVFGPRGVGGSPRLADAGRTLQQPGRRFAPRRSAHSSKPTCSVKRSASSSSAP